jgi:hypothetical protein
MSDPFGTIRERFRRRCADDLALVRASLIDPGELAGPKFQTVIHQMSGMAGSIGFDDLSRIAGEMDEVLAAGGVPEPADLHRLESALSDIATGLDPSASGGNATP